MTELANMLRACCCVYVNHSKKVIQDAVAVNDCNDCIVASKYVV